MIADGESRIPRLGEEFRALLLVLVLLSRLEVWLQSRSRLDIPCRVIWNTARRYHEYHATIHWKHESGWNVGIISNSLRDVPYAISGGLNFW